jgi:hypothetical protein
VTWFRNDQKLLPGSETQLRFSQGSAEGNRTHFLDISEVHTEDEGKWICLVENFSGRVSSVANIRVLGKNQKKMVYNDARTWTLFYHLLTLHFFFFSSEGVPSTRVC